MLVVPLPPALLDILLALDIAGAAIVLLAALSSGGPLELASFPSLLLVATLFRLSLDVSATRLILTHGADEGGVGAVIPAFGDFVFGGNLVVGMLLFAILAVVQLVVVTNGAQRVAEVAARFTLDALPGKQMAIDADLHAGLIDSATARERRRAVQAEADFYGAMDGAGKFVRGDAVAAIVIVVVNLIAGTGIGIVAQHMDAGAALSTYALYSVGNAMATTLPAFLLSTAMGVIVTRSASEADLGADLVRQVLGDERALRTVGIGMLALALVPGLPHVAFGAMGLGCVAFATFVRRAAVARAQRVAIAEVERRRDDDRRPEAGLALVGVDPVALRLGRDLWPLLDEPVGAELLERISLVRKRLALELGLVLPSVRVRDEPQLAHGQYAVMIRDREVLRGDLDPERIAALGQPAALSALRGERTTIADVDATFIDPEASIPAGMTAVDALGVLASALAAAARRHAAELLGRQDVQQIVDRVRQSQPAVVKGVVPETIGLGLLQRVLQGLLREGVSIRDIASILETLADEAESTRAQSALIEAARRRLAPSICATLATAGTLRVLAVESELERVLETRVREAQRGPSLALDVDEAVALSDAFQAAATAQRVPVVLCSQPLRPALARFFELAQTDHRAIGVAEVAPGYTVDVAAIVQCPSVWAHGNDSKPRFVHP